eukprot:scaffold111928_cov63-Phaeocystis_antarctica.AAC.2
MGARVRADLVARGRQLAGELAEEGRLHEAAERLCEADAGFGDGDTARACCWARGCARGERGTPGVYSK